MLCHNCMMAIDVSDKKLHEYANKYWKTQDFLTETWKCRWCGYEEVTQMIKGRRVRAPFLVLKDIQEIAE